MTGIKLQNQSSAVTFSKLNRATLHTAAYLLNWSGCFLCTKENQLDNRCNTFNAGESSFLWRELSIKLKEGSIRGTIWLFLPSSFIDHSFPAHPLAPVHSYILLLAYYPVTCSPEVSGFQLNQKLSKLTFYFRSLKSKTALANHPLKDKLKCGFKIHQQSMVSSLC